MSEKINRLEVVSSFFGNPVDPTTKMDKIQYKINNKDIISLKYPAEIKYKPYIVNGGLIYDKGNKPAYGFKIVYNNSKWINNKEGKLIIGTVRIHIIPDSHFPVSYF